LTVQISVDLSNVQNFIQKLKEMPDEVQKKLTDVLSDVGRQTVIKARAYAPVRTGALRASIYATTTRNLELRIGAYVYYALFQEYGTRYIAPRYFLTRAVQENLPLLRTRMLEAIAQTW
jgi:HK97 gp10 family phage protein